jgi:2-polyprenyl-6-methoxyphenol hydroxylase-like FAD-dependent oxidoreductase
MSEDQPAPDQDVVILGGGLAGLTLALQLRQRLPEAGITVLERQRHPAPAATHKVGESSVEIAAHYFDTVLGLRSHLADQQLNKFGFRFFFSDGRKDIDAVTELGASRFLATPSYQIDRGPFENFLGNRARDANIRFLEGCTVRELELGGAGRGHEIGFDSAEGPRFLRARWLLDASGRAGLLKRKLGLATASPHNANAVWFRVGAKIDIDEWSADPAWRTRCDPPSRWLSTNHLVGCGYWVWLIPLACGSHSVGIVADARRHPLEEMNSFDRALAWLRRHQPRLAEDLEAKRDSLLDFRYFRRFSYGCQRLFSRDRWAITGEAGVFLDPFYSPGGDFIAIANTYIEDLVARDLAGESISRRAAVYDHFFSSFCDSTLTLYLDQYGLFGDPDVLPVKVLWDYAYYWGVLCQLFFQGRLTDLAALGRLHRELIETRELNRAMQEFMRRWSAHSRGENRATMLDQASLAWFAELNRGLRDRLDDEGFHARMLETAAQLAELARQIVAHAVAGCPDLDTSGISAVLPRSSGPPAASMLFPVG